MTTAPRISICIPAYDMGGQGADFLAASFARMGQQSLHDFDVVVSDQSDTTDVAQVCTDYSDRLRITRVDYAHGPRQASANTNNAMRHAGGEILKILFQDDLLAGPDALTKTARAFEGTAAWALCGSAVTYDGQTAERAMVPRMHPQIRFGKNTVSSPSVLAMRRDAMLEFDENLIWLMDVEMYHRLHITHGPPEIVPDVLVWNRLHDGQVSAGVSPDLRKRELSYVRDRTREDETWGDWWEYRRQRLKAR
ncbi:MAG: glycosyltransferase [Pseudomonadota bacterium]